MATNRNGGNRGINQSTMLKGKDSLSRLVGKRRRFLPHRESLFSTHPETCSIEFNGQGSSNQEKRVSGGGNGEAKGQNGDWVTCPVCGTTVRGDDYMVNTHLDACLARGTKRKLAQRTLLHFSFSPRSKDKIDKGKSISTETSEIQSCSNVNHSQSPVYIMPGVGGSIASNSTTISENCEMVSVETQLTSDVMEDNKADTITVFPNCDTSELDATFTDDKSVKILETFIVGRRFSDEVELKQGDTISLLRDPDNIKDPSAIKVLSTDSGNAKVLGFLPRELAKYLSSLIDNYNLSFKGSVLSLPSHPLDVVPIQIICQEIPFHGVKEATNGKDFESLWKSVLSVTEHNKTSPPSLAKYQQNFCVLLQEVMMKHDHLFSDDEKLFIESFKALSDDSQRLFVRLYTRKGPWFRMAGVLYPEILDHQQAIVGLCASGYMCSLESMKLNVDDLREVLDVLNVSEIREILRRMHLKIQKDSTRKQELVASLLAPYKDGMCPSLLGLILDQTGTCVRISPTAEYLLWRVQRLFFLNGDQDLSAFLLVDFGLVKYPTYNCMSSNHIFPGRSDLLAYEEAIEVAQVMDQSVDENNTDMVMKCIGVSDCHISNNPEKVLQSSSPYSSGTFLSFFTASWVYSKVITLGVSFLEREHRYKDAIKLLRSLLRRMTSGGRRGYWTLRLSVDLEHIGHLDESLSVAEEGLLDPWVRAGSKMALQRRVLRLGKPPRRWKLPSYAESIKRKIKEVHVLGRPLNCDLGIKNRFYSDDGDQCGVEELALQYYAGEGGGWQGVHTETGIWVTIFGILLWDVIFTDVPDVFCTRFQTAPLDLETDNFYVARKSQIESHLQKIYGGMAEEILIMTWESHFGTSCRGVNWDRHSLSELRAAVTCVGGPRLASLCRLLAQDYRSWSRGMPDLFLWRFLGEYKGEAKLVEVKGPRDRLSEQQRAWLLLLMDCGFNVEVCKVSPEARST